jgi:phage baseplate assembly protein W
MVDGSHLLTDVRLRRLHRAFRPLYTVDGHRRDVALVSGRENLGQAILIRLLTPRGELADLAHPDFGSRLHELIGRANTETVRNLAKLYVLEALQVEPRVEEIVEVTVTPVTGQPDRFDILVRVRPVGESGVVSVGPFTLELGA